MKLATFTTDGTTRIGVVVDDVVIDLSQAAPDLPTDMVAFLSSGPEAMAAAASAAERCTPDIPLESVHLEPPVLRPRKYLGVGGNYFLRHLLPDMTEEAFRTLQATQSEKHARKHQAWFNKQVTCLNGPFDACRVPEGTTKLLPECELGFVVGTRCHRVKLEDAASVIAGYLICNDFTMMDWVFPSCPSPTLAKSFDTLGPIGPWIVTRDEIPDPHSLRTRTVVNGEEWQRGNTADMILNCFDLVAQASQVFTLEPGDIITTGMSLVPFRYVNDGDVVRCEVEGIGHIENRITIDKLA